MAEWAGGLLAPADPDTGAHIIASGVTLDMLSLTLGRLASDPPRDDYESATQLRRLLPSEYVPPPRTSLGEVALELTQAADEAEAHLAAGLRALERYQGAIRRSQFDVAQARKAEAERYIRSAATPVRTCAARVDDMRETDQMRSPAESRNIRPRSPSDLPRETLAVIYLRGMRLEALARTLRRAPRRWDNDEAALASKRLRAVSDHIRTWGLPPDIGAT
jgi:hypothetical protein